MVEKEDAVGLEFGEDLTSECTTEHLLLARDHEVNVSKEASRAEIQLPQLLLLQPQKASEGSHPDTKKLIQVGGEDRQELETLKKRDPRVHSLLEDPTVEGQPGDFSVEESVRVLSRTFGRP